MVVVPLRVAESVTEPPTVIVVAERVVESDLCPATVRGSQGDVAPLLLASPEYIPFQLNDPNVLKVWDAESGTTPFVTETGVPTAVAVPVHVEPVKNS